MFILKLYLKKINKLVVISVKTQTNLKIQIFYLQGQGYVVTFKTLKPIGVTQGTVLIRRY